MQSSAPDLAAVRLRLTKMTDRVLMRLHDRAGFPLNPRVYEAGAIPIPGRSGLSLFDFAVEGLEAYHSSLGRYEFPDQYPLSPAGRPRESSAAAETPRDVEIPLREDLIAFYTHDVLPRLCAPGDDPGCYGETAYVDADLIELLNERLNLGRAIALAKVEREPDLFDLTGDEPRLGERLTDKGRERDVIADAMRVAERYDLDPEVARFVFEWIIARTLRLEVDYLRLLRESRAGPPGDG